MTTENDQYRFIALFKQLSDAHDSLHTSMFDTYAYTADVNEVELSEEDKMAKGELSLGMTHHKDEPAIAAALAAWRHYTVSTGCSTKYVKRYGGFVSVKDPHALSIVRHINALKDKLKACVQDASTHTKAVKENGEEVQKTITVHGRNTYQKHQFIHKVAPRIMTLQLYRHIPIFEKPVESISFYWTNKLVPKRMNKETAVDYIKRKYDTPERLAQQMIKIADIQNSDYEDFEIEKVQNAALMASLYDGRRTHNMQSTTPMILTQPSKPLSFNDVPAYKLKDPKQEVLRKQSRSIICSVTNLYGVRRLKDNKNG